MAGRAQRGWRNRIVPEDNRTDDGYDSSSLSHDETSGSDNADSELGFPNLGNTCFANAVLQALTSLEGFDSNVHKASRFLAANSCPKIDTFESFLNLVNKEDIPASLQTILNRTGFTNRRQHDAYEFFTKLLEAFEEEFNMAVGTTSIADPSKFCFEATMEMDKYCRKCNKHNKTRSQETHISAPLTPETRTIFDTVFNLKQEESVEYSCVCDSNDATIQKKFATLPRYLVVCLKRYSLENGKCSKKSNAIKIDKTLFIQQSEGEKVTKNYKLMSIITHDGEQPNRGHYVCFVRKPYAWLKFDDSTVTQVTDAKVMDFTRTRCYMVFYERN